LRSSSSHGRDLGNARVALDSGGGLAGENSDSGVDGGHVDMGHGLVDERALLLLHGGGRGERGQESGEGESLEDGHCDG
jgi:hypothetical protein